MKKIYGRLAASTFLVGLIGCGSQVVTQKFPAGTSPDEAISIAQERKDKALAEHADALAHDEYYEGQDALASIHKPGNFCVVMAGGRR